jgi:hypothetical protein
MSREALRCEPGVEIPGSIYAHKIESKAAEVQLKLPQVEASVGA